TSSDRDWSSDVCSSDLAVRFASAEPFRFAIAAKPCKYWQTDHWSIQLDRGFTAVVRWDGSYWFDKGSGIGAVLMRHFRIGGQREIGRASCRGEGWRGRV